MSCRNPANPAHLGPILRSSLTAVVIVGLVACSSAQPADGVASTPGTVPLPSISAPSTAAARPPTEIPSTTSSTGSTIASTTSTAATATATPSTTTTAPVNIYSGAGLGKFSPAVFGAKQYVYVPSNSAGTVTVIDQATMTVIDHFAVGKLAQHVVPSWDLRTLYATASSSNRLVPIDPLTGKPGKPIKVDAPYNLYFTPDGTTAVVMAERLNTINYYDTATWTKIRSVKTKGCRGVNHADCEMSQEVTPM